MTSELVIVITGASRGFGRALAIMAARSFNPSSDFDVMLVLVARSTEGLEETARLVRDQTGVPGNNFQVSCHAMDLGDLKQLDENIDQLIQEFDRQGCTTRKIIFIQNAGTIGFLGPCRNSPSLKDLQSNVDLNITSCLWISARLTRYANSSEKPTDLIIVNVSSLVAIADFPTFGMYSAGKAARDKYHTLIASEETTSSTGDQTKPRIRTLNYAPVSIIFGTNF